MRCLLFVFLISYSAYAQLSETISLSYPEIIESVSNIHTANNYKYISASNLYTSPTGQLEREIEVSKLSPCNEIIWSKNFNVQNANLEHRQILQEYATDNLFIVGFYVLHSNPQKFLYVQKIDSEGNVLFAKSYDFGNQIMGNAYTQYSTKTGIVVTAKYSPLGGGGSLTTLISVKNNGELEYAFRQKDTYTGISAAQVDDDVYFIRSYNTVYLTHKDGTVYWAKTYPQLLSSSNFFNALFVKDGYIISVRTNAQYYLVKLNLDGSFLWKTNYKSTGYWPALYSTHNLIHIASFSSINGNFKPIILTYNQNGTLIKEQVLDNLGVDAYSIPSVFIHENEKVDIVYSASLSNQSNFKSIILSENVHTSSCLEDIILPELENPVDTTSSTDVIQSTPLPVSNIIDHQITITDISITDSVRCQPLIIPDSISIQETLDCDSGYTYFGTDDNMTYYWPIDGSTDPIRHFSDAGTYEVILENCHSKTHTFITVNDYCACDLFVPNAFSPNGDELNNSFGGINNCDIAYYKLEIFDRWGKRIFISNTIDDQWDGTYKHAPVKSDLYIYKIEYTPMSGNNITPNIFKQGSVLVVY